MIDLIAFRRSLHRYPEPGWCEYLTTAQLVEALSALNFDVEFGPTIHTVGKRLGVPNGEVLSIYKQKALERGADPEVIDVIGNGYTGVIASFDTGTPGPTVGLRVDIDSNDLIESNDPNHAPVLGGFASENYGAMHACGHDAHAAIGLGVAQWVANNFVSLSGTVKIIFQPAEEGLRGAASLVDAGMLDDIDKLIAIHMRAGMPLGHVECAASGFLASTKYDATFCGTASHAGNDPEAGENALLAAATAALNLHAMPRDSRGMSRINVGVLEAGTGRNVTPDKAILKFETRGSTSEINEDLGERAKCILEGAALMQRVEVSFQRVGHAAECAPDVELATQIQDSSTEVAEVDRATIAEYKLIGSEDAMTMIKRVQKNGGQGTYVLFGSEKKNGHHTVRFDIDEKVIPLAVSVISSALKSLLKEEGSHESID